VIIATGVQQDADEREHETRLLAVRPEPREEE